MDNVPGTESTYKVIKILGQDGGDRRMFRINLIQIGSKNYAEARIYYKGKQGATSPTRKGIVITPSNFLSLCNTVESKNDEIRKWLGLAFIPDEIIDNSDQMSIHASMKCLPKELEWTIEEIGINAPPYTVYHNGSKTIVEFNSLNAWTKTRIVNASDEVIVPLIEIIAADDIARQIASNNSDNDEYKFVFHLIDINKSIILNSKREV